MDRAQVAGNQAVGKLERLFEGLTVEGLGLWFNVVHEGADEASPVTNIGGQYGVREGEPNIILLCRRGEAYLDLFSGESSACEPTATWELALPWMVADGTWKEVRRRVVVAEEGSAGAISGVVR
jgi:hypothetical protein